MIQTFRNLALSFEAVTEAPHHEVISFKVKGKIFATLNPPHSRGCLRLSDFDQSLFIRFEDGALYPVPNKWGKFGWTNVDLTRVSEELLADAMIAAYCCVAPAKLAARYLEEGESRQG